MIDSLPCEKQMKICQCTCHLLLPTERQIVYVDIRSLGEAGRVALERASPITVTICDHYTRTRYQQEFKISF
jgi:hypothetical protein